MTTASSPVSQNTAIFYPTGDGELVAETFAHLYALLITLEKIKPCRISRSHLLLEHPDSLAMPKSDRRGKSATIHSSGA